MGQKQYSSSTPYRYFIYTLNRSLIIWLLTKMLHKPCLKVSPSTFDINRKENILVNRVMEVYRKQNIERCGIQGKIIIKIQIGWLHILGWHPDLETMKALGYPRWQCWYNVSITTIILKYNEDRDRKKVQKTLLCERNMYKAK